MYTGSSYDNNVGFHTVIWIEHYIDNNQLNMKTTKYNFWLRPDSDEWRCIKEIRVDTLIVYYASNSRVE